MRDPALRQSKILIIDDEPAVVTMVRQLLELDGYHNIRGTTNPAAAAQLFAEFQPDLVILDLIMPVVSGLQVLSQLREMIPPNTYLPILVVTGDRGSDARRAALDRGASDFVAKPYDVTEILARIGYMLETRFLHLQPLEEAKRFLQATIDALSSQIAILDESGTIIAVNQAWNRFARNEGGIRNADVGENFLHHCATVPEHCRKTAEAAAGGIRAVMAGEVAEFLLDYECHNDGTQCWFHVRVTRFGGSGPLRVVISRANITARKLAEQSLRASEENLAAAQRIAHLGSWELDVSHSGDGAAVLLRWSDEMFRIAGYAPGAFELTWEAFFRLVPEEEHRIIQNAIADAFAGRREFAIIHRLIRPDGVQRFVRATGQISFDEQTGRPSRMVGTTQDITEQRRAEESIRVQAHMLDSVGQAVIATDLAGCIFYANRFADELYGWAPGELLGRNILEFTLPQASLERNGEIMSHLRRGETWSGEFLVHGRDGRSFSAHVTESPLLDERGELVGIIGISKDITERKMAEAALCEAEEKYRGIFANAMEGIFQNTPEGTMISANPALARMLGFDSPEELIQARTDLARQGYAEPAERQQFQLMLEQRGMVTNFEYEVKRKDGSLIWVSENVRIVRNAAGEALFYEGSVQDITARKQNEEALFRSRETLRGILDSIPQRVFWKDRDSVYLGCNHSCAADMGFDDPAEVIGKTDSELSWKALADRYRADDLKIMDHDRSKIGLEIPSITPDGRPKWDRTSKVPLHDQQGRVIGVLGTYEDVTEHKLAKLEIERLNADLEKRVAQRTEQLLASTQEAERANRAKSDFLSRTSHELRTPLNAILGFAQLMAMDETLGSEPRESVGEILRSGEHLLTLINAVLDISNADANGPTLSLEPVAVKPLIDETLCLARPLGRTCGVGLERDVPPEGNPRVLADGQRLKEALASLLSNAIKYNHAGGQVIVQYAEVDAGGTPALRLLVRDNGSGISTENLPRLFAPFDRLDMERTRAHINGVGLGLALSKRMVELMGGRIGVESTLGEGSVFWIELPLVQVSAPSPGEPAPAFPVPTESTGKGSRTFLYVDHSASNFRLVGRILARRPAIRLVTADSVPLALAAVAEYRPDFILLEMDLPDGGSEDLLAQLRANPHTASIPVAVISAELPPEKRAQLVEAGVGAFLTKPLEMREFLQVLDQSIGSRPIDATPRP